MNYWWMSLPQGRRGLHVWPELLRRGIAAISYRYVPSEEPVVGDMSDMTLDEFERHWRESGIFNNSMKVAFRCLRFEMQPGDVIYARSSPHIVGKGKVTSPYQWGPSTLEGSGDNWEHFVRVDWERLPPFKIIIHRSPHMLWRLEGEGLERMLEAEARARARADDQGKLGLSE
jgi:hypothetical protein